MKRRLTLDEVKPGNRVRVRCTPERGFSFVEKIEFVSGPYVYEGAEQDLLRGTLWVKVKLLTQGGREEHRSLADMGVVPYKGDSGDVWNERNFPEAVA